jgi:translation initiation factor 4E
MSKKEALEIDPAAEGGETVEETAAVSPAKNDMPEPDEGETPPPVVQPQQTGGKADSPLNAKWTLWFDNPKLAPAGSDWKENLKIIGSFDTVGSFWRIFNNIKPASDLAMNSNYSIFKYGIEPSWEDKGNCDGGKFVLTIPRKESKSGKCDEHWLFTVLAIIGETMDETGDQVNGAVVSIRKHQDRIALWLKTSDPQMCIEVGQRWKKVLNLEKTVLRYQTHRDAAASGRSFRNEVQFQV